MAMHMLMRCEVGNPGIVLVVRDVEGDDMGLLAIVAIQVVRLLVQLVLRRPAHLCSAT